MMKIVVQILFLFLPALTIAQCHLNAKRVDLGTTQNFPMRNGKVHYTDPGCSWNSCKQPGVIIDSNCDSVFSTCYGKVSAIFNLGDYECVIIRSDENTFYSFTLLSFVIVKKGDYVIKGTLLGKSEPYRDKGLYSINYTILDKDAKYFSDEEVWELLKQSNQSECKDEGIVYQSNQ